MATTHRPNPVDDDLPPAYTPLPRPTEQSLDAGAGSPVTRRQHAVFAPNPSDPRSRYYSDYFRGNRQHQGHYHTRPDLRSGPVAAPQLPPRSSTLTRTRRAADDSSFRPARDGDLSMSYSTMRRASDNALNRHPATVRGTWNCARCRDSGWRSRDVYCDCVAGAAVREAERTYQPRSFMDAINTVVNPRSRVWAVGVSGAPPLPRRQDSDARTAPYYVQFIPGHGNLCPNCCGQAYFRSPDAQSLPVIDRIRRNFAGSLPPPCSVCKDRGRVPPP